MCAPKLGSLCVIDIMRRNGKRETRFLRTHTFSGKKCLVIFTLEASPEGTPEAVFGFSFLYGEFSKKCVFRNAQKRETRFLRTHTFSEKNVW